VVALAGGHKAPGVHADEAAPPPSRAPAEHADERPTVPPPAVVAVAAPPAARAVEHEEIRGAAPSAIAPSPAHKLRLTSIPSDAEVVLDGKVIGRTPLFGVDIDTSRTHALLIRKEGFAPHQQAITASSDWTIKASDKSVATLKISVLLARTGAAAP